MCDRVFTRVGAGDNLARGESTFMVEMRETAAILRDATARSLVILDEIGRGTSTFDGVSIAWAVAEHLHDRVGARTLFATHYHELVALAGAARARAQRLASPCASGKGEVVFLRKLTPGGASRSYGVEVAKLAGLPPPVIDRARAILRTLESEAGPRSADLPRPVAPGRRGADRRSSACFRAATTAARPIRCCPCSAEVAATLRATDPDELSPAPRTIW